MDRLKALHQFHEEDPEDPFTRFALAAEYLKTGDAERALAFLEALREENPTYVGTYYHLGKLYESLGRKDDAEATYRQGIRQAGETGDTHSRSELEEALNTCLGLEMDDEAD
jgi:Tfp pilus assembly protein PilF